jgi:TPR repeat protein
MMNNTFEERNLSIPHVLEIFLSLLMICSLHAFANDVSNSRPVINLSDKLARPEGIKKPTRPTDEIANASMQDLYQAKNQQEYDHALAAMQALVDKGNIAAAFKLGRYFHLEAQNPNYIRALVLYTIAMDKGDGWAANNIGLMYEQGRGVAMDVNKAIEYYKLAVARGHYHGFTNLARLYFTGHGVQKNAVIAQSWLDEGMKQGILEVYEEASSIYYYGWYGLSVDFPRSLRYEEAAAKLGSNKAAWEAAKMYLDGIGIPQDTGRAIEIFYRLAVLDYAPALNSLGAIYANGKGVPTDKRKAIDYWERAAALHSCIAISNLGNSYDKGLGVQVDKGRATDYMRDAANCGNPPSGFDVWKLATRYRDAAGVVRSCGTAQKLFERAITLNYLDAITDLGYLHQNGCEEIQPDQKIAFRIYLAGAKLGVVLCQNNVGAMLKHGYGVEAPDRVKAYAWLILAAENGSEIAKKNLTDFGEMFSADNQKEGLQHLQVIKQLIKTDKKGTFKMDDSY